MLHQRKFNRAHQVGQFMVSIQKKVNRKDKVKEAYKKKNICGLSRVWMREESNNTILLWFSITSDMYTVILRVGCGEEARKSSFNRDLWVVAPWWVMSILCLLAVDLFPRKLRFHPVVHTQDSQLKDRTGAGEGLQNCYSSSSSPVVLLHGDQINFYKQNYPYL